MTILEELTAATQSEEWVILDVFGTPMAIHIHSGVEVKPNADGFVLATRHIAPYGTDDVYPSAREAFEALKQWAIERARVAQGLADSI